MARKNVIKGFKPMDAADISGNVESTVVNLINMDKAAFHVTWTGTSPVGTLAVKAKNGEDDSFYDLDSLDAISITGNSGEHVIMLLEISFTEVKLVYTSSSGTGSMTVNMTAKQIGG